MLLKFKTAGVRKLIQHIKSSKEHTAPYGIGTPVPSFHLVKDQGVYLMSSGSENLPREDGKEGSFVVYAEGLDPDKDEDWYDVAHELGGDDFVEVIKLTSNIEKVVENPLRKFFVVDFQ